MVSLSMKTNVVLLFLLVSLSSLCNAMLLGAKTAVITSLDPIVNTGGVASHVHVVIGGSGFSATYDNDAYTNADCTTINTIGDNSNYWTAQCYGKNPNGTYTLLPLRDARVYYFNNKLQNAEPFPKGLRMISGNATSNEPSPVPETFWTCLGPDSTVTGNFKGFPPGRCSDGLRASIRFPDCWNGNDLDSPDHASHMAMSEGNICPDTHPVIVPRIILEVAYYSGDYDGSKGEFILSTGDLTGKSLHADFAEGWNQTLLREAMNDPTCNDRQNTFGDKAQCEALLPFYQQDPNCTMRNAIPQEDVGLLGPIDQLPGCNAEWNEGEAKPGCDSFTASEPPAIEQASGYINVGENWKMYGGNMMWEDIQLPYSSYAADVDGVDSNQVGKKKRMHRVRGRSHLGVF